MSVNNSTICQVRIQGIKDAMEVLSGKWKFHILGTLTEVDQLGFMELMREVKGIGSKMLSKELQDLEINQLISRTVVETKPLTIYYALTPQGRKLVPIIDQIANWGVDYRKAMLT